MRVLYSIEGKFMVSIFEDVCYYEKDTTLLFSSSHCDRFLVTTDIDTAMQIIFNLYEHGKVDLRFFGDYIKIKY